ELHEYIADAAIVQDKNKSDYYEKLLAEVFQTQQFSFTNQFFKHSLIKKRIIMLTKQKSRQILKLKYLVLIPVLIGSLLYTSCEDTTIVDEDDKTAVVDQKLSVEHLKDLLREFNALNVNLGKNQILTRDQYEKQTELLKEITQLMQDSDGKLTSIDMGKARSYEAYVAARKESIAEGKEYSELENEAIAFTLIDEAPVFPGCEDAGTLEEIKKCFSKNLQMHVNRGFDTKKASELNLVGVQRIFVKFIVNKNGEIAEIDVRAPHPLLEEETERVINSLPKFTPAMKDGKPVSLKYVLPIAFTIQE
uniref:energy transducer TonB n=1 Tax=Kordia sp. TaxID=1965332 RepID=UPI003D6BCC69